MKTLSIGITTFRNRLNDVTKQIKQIRNIDKNIEIILAVTNNYGEKMDETYRKSILQLCIDYDKIYPLMFPKYTGLAKMWNNIVIHSTTSHVLLMNDDLNITNSMLFNNLRIEIQTYDAVEINNTFGNFIVSKTSLDEVGYFDERLLAYGFEDGDFRERFLKTYNKTIFKINQQGIVNNIKNRFKDSYMDKIDCYKDAWGGNKPIVNKKIIELKANGKLPDINQYPYEKFISNNFNNIGKIGDILL